VTTCGSPMTCESRSTTRGILLHLPGAFCGRSRRP
jgi:hypothetical protein